MGQHITIAHAPTTAAEEDGALPAAYALDAAYPNPFNPATTIPFDVAATAHVVIQVYDGLGRAVARLADETFPPGRHQVRWQADGMPAGVYLVRMQAGGRRYTRTVALAK